MTNSKQMKARTILRLAAWYFEIPIEVLLSRDRSMPVVRQRQIVGLLMQQHTSLSLTQIAGILKRTHSTMSQNNQTVKELLKTDAQVQKDYTALDRFIKEEFVPSFDMVPTVSGEAIQTQPFCR